MRSQSAHEIEKKMLYSVNVDLQYILGMIRSTYTYYMVLQQSKE